jgi:hypothetical protein
MDLPCVGGPCDGQVASERDGLRLGDQVMVYIKDIFDPEKPVYLPWDDPRNSPARSYATYCFDGHRLVAQ